MPLDDVSELISKMTGGDSGAPENLWWHKVGRVAGAAATANVAGRETSLWLYDGQPSAGVAPGAVAVPTSATSGALKQTDGAGGLAKYLVGGGVTGLNAGTLTIYDRLLHISGFDATNTGAQNVGGSLTRYTDGIGNVIFLEIYTQVGGSARAIVANYTDQDDNAAVTPSVLIGGTALRDPQRIIRLPLAVGDRGVKGVTDVVLALSTGGVGDFGVTIGHPLFQASVTTAGFGSWRSFIDGHGPPEIVDGACLAATWVALGAAVPELQGSFSFVDA